MTRLSRKISIAIAFGLILLIMPSSVARAQTDDAAQRADEHVENARGILDGGFVGSNHPWYSSEDDDATLIPISAPRARSTGDPWYQFILDFIEWMSEPLFYDVNMWMILLTVLILIPLIWFFVKLYKNRGKNLGGGAEADFDEERTDAQRMEALPFEIKPADNLLDVARKFAETGRYADAIIYLFSHQLVELDRAHVIRLTKGKTNRQYLREINLRELRSLMEQSTVAFEDAFFGHYEINKARFEQCWQRIDEFRGLVMRGRAMA